MQLGGGNDTPLALRYCKDLLTAPEEHTFVFESTQHVGLAAEQVAKDFGYAPGNHTFQTREDDVLERGLTLQAAHVHNHQLLELVDVGGGV